MQEDAAASAAADDGKEEQTQQKQDRILRIRRILHLYPHKSMGTKESKHACISYEDAVKRGELSGRRPSVDGSENDRGNGSLLINAT